MILFYNRRNMDQKSIELGQMELGFEISFVCYISVFSFCVIENFYYYVFIFLILQWILINFINKLYLLSKKQFMF